MKEQGLTHDGNRIHESNMVFQICIHDRLCFSRFRFREKFGLLSILILQMFPSFMGMMAMYNILWQLNLLNTHFGLILTYTAGQIPYNTWLVKGYAQYPRSLDEAARLDGASNLASSGRSSCR